LVNGKRSRNVVLIIILVIPLLGVGPFNPTTEFSVWVVDSDSRDVSTDIAVRTLLDEVASTKLNIKETTLARLESVPLYIDLLVLVGHGQAEGLSCTMISLNVNRRRPLYWHVILHQTSPQT
jgi:hypothetical protein